MSKEITYTLMTPGPVPLPPEVLEILAKPMEHHRTPEFVALWNRVLANLKKVFMTDQPVFVHTSTGSGGMESALVNCLSPGDHIIVIVSGKFGERWAEMAEAFGVKVISIEVTWGKAVTVNELAATLKQFPQAAAVLCQACETSTGVLHPIKDLAHLISQYPALFMVDAITALGALPIPMDQWKIDVLIAGSQKAFMLPTGLSFISFSQKAWLKTATARCPKYYFDIRREKAANDNGESFFSTAVSHVRALNLVLDIFLKQGLDKVQGRIQALSRATLAAASELGLSTFSETPSPSITALKIPDGIDGQKVRAEMEKHDHVIVMGGQDQLKGKIVRIGHMGAISDSDLLRTIHSLAQSINRLKPATISETQMKKAETIATAILKEVPAVVLRAKQID